jgi:hypothetical protein
MKETSRSPQYPEADSFKSEVDLSALPDLQFSKASQVKNKTVSCPNCRYDCLPGEFTCPNCHTMFSSDRPGQRAGSTNKLGDQKPLIEAPILHSTRGPIVLEIGENRLLLPLTDSLIIGRLNPGDELRPDVELNVFGAVEKGVSRHHLRIIRRNTLVYVIDLSSTNGTFVNGQRVLPNCQRVLRSGDELRLGYLKIKVKF